MTKDNRYTLKLNEGLDEELEAYLQEVKTYGVTNNGARQALVIELLRNRLAEAKLNKAKQIKNVRTK